MEILKYIKPRTVLVLSYTAPLWDTDKKRWAEPYDECLSPAGSLHPPKYLASTWFSADSPDLALLGQEHHKTCSSTTTTCQKDTHQQLVSSFSVRFSASPARRKSFCREPDYPCSWCKICHLWICKNLWFADQTGFFPFFIDISRIWVQIITVVENFCPSAKQGKALRLNYSHATINDTGFVLKIADGNGSDIKQ